MLKPKAQARLYFSNFLYDNNFSVFVDYAMNPWKRSKIRMRHHTIPELEKIMGKLGFRIQTTESNGDIVMLVSKP